MDMERKLFFRNSHLHIESFSDITPGATGVFSCWVKIIQKLEAVARRCSVKKVFLITSQNSQENTCARISSLIKLQASGLRPATLLKKGQHRCFPENFVKFLRTPFLKNFSGWLLLASKDLWSKSFLIIVKTKIH